MNEAVRMESVAEGIRTMVARGGLRPGERLPSVRERAREEGVAPGTVVLAYRTLEGEGLVEARARSGYFVKRRDDVRSPTLPRSSRVPSRIALPAGFETMLAAMQSRDVVSLATATLAPELLPLRELGRLLAGLARESASLGGRYEVPPGPLTLRRSITKLWAERGLVVPEDGVVTTAGAMEGIRLAFSVLARAGDVVVVETPTYFGVLQLLSQLGLRVVEAPVHPETGFSVSAFEALVKQTQVAACFLTPSFQNPLGCSMPDGEKERLVGVARAHGVALIEDDIYADLGFDGYRHKPLRVFEETPAAESNVLTVGSVSKMLAPGYRVGWIAGGKHHERLVRAQFAQSVACASPTQLAVAEFLGSRAHARHRVSLQRAIRTQVSALRDHVLQTFPAGTRVSNPAGGFVLWVELPAGASSLDLQVAAHARGVSFAPGPIFSARGAFQRCLRLSAGQPFSRTMARAVGLVAELAFAQTGGPTRTAQPDHAG